jgi:F-type H+-transporting ATPase subunit b
LRVSHARFSVAKICFALLALFVLAAAVSPLRSRAQEPVPAAAQPAASGQASQPSDVSGLPAQPGQEKKEKEEEESDNVYRHTPLVTSIAKALNLPVETTARLFEIINFAVIVLAIVIPLAKFLPKHLRKRRETLSQNLEAARKTTQDANSRLSAVEAQLSRLDDEIAKIRAQVEDESRQDEVRIKASIEEERTRIVAAAEQEIGVAAAQAKRGLRNFAADLAIEQAAKQLVLTPETDQALIAEFVSDVTGNGTKGGRN